jgi:hypothetical protein
MDEEDGYFGEHVAARYCDAGASMNSVMHRILEYWLRDDEVSTDSGKIATALRRRSPVVCCAALYVIARSSAPKRMLEGSP